MESALKNNGMYESITFNDNVIQTLGISNISLLARLNGNSFVTYKMIPAYNCITKIDLPTQVELKLTSKFPFSYTAGIIPKYYNKTKIEDYLYEITYGNLDYDYAFKNFKPSKFKGCSAIRNNNWFGRNFDWLYNNEVQFVVHTPSSINYFSTLGVAGIIPGIEQSNVDNNDIIIDNVDMFKLVPFYLLDGINEKGLFCTHNIVPLDNEESPTTEIKALHSEKYKINAMMLVRFILDKFQSAKEAITYIKNYVTIYFFDEMIEAGYQSHFMVGDYNNTYIIEFIDNSIKVIKANYITNFPIFGVKFDKLNYVQYPPTLSGINKYGSGLERWQIITDNYKYSNTLNGMHNTLNKIMYSNCYSEPFWYSEIVKMKDDNGLYITVDTPKEFCSAAKARVLSRWKNKNRDNPKVWITCHSCIYNIKNKIMYIRNQENLTLFKFNLL